jgi:hypothetical protein
MGYPLGATAAPGVPESERRAAMGRCMDMNVMQALMAISFAWFRAHHWVSSPVQLRVQISYQPPSRLGQAPMGIAASLASGRTTHHVLAAYVHNVVLTDCGREPRNQHRPAADGCME